MKRLFVSVLSLLAVVLTAAAQLSLPNVFSNDMVLQQGKKVAIWGEAKPATKVVVKFADQTVATVADAEGKWSLHLNEMTASAEPRTLTIRSGREKISYEGVLVGEVWLASGQSNMEYSMGNHPHYPRPARGDRDILMKEYYEADAPLVRVLYVNRKILHADTLPTNGWKRVTTENIKPVSAAGYFFAKRLADSLNVPIGLVSTSYGGSPVEAWTPVEAYRESERFAADVDDKDNYKGVPIGNRYRKFLAPIVPYTLRGFLWYQGEQNLTVGMTDTYAEQQNLLIESWRKLWGDEELPFYFAQLAPYAYSQQRTIIEPRTWDELPQFWEQQKASLALPHTGMITTLDLVDDVKEIHPPYKWIVGQRFADLALAKTYGREGIVTEGPVMKSVTIDTKNKKAIVEFDNVGSGLKTTTGTPYVTFFRLAGESGRFYGGVGKITGKNTVEVTSQWLGAPIVYVCFSWDEASGHNLLGGDGLPAQPFNTLWTKQQAEK